MSNLNRHPVRRAAAGVLAGALALSGGALVAAPSAFAAPGFQLDRIAGVDRYATSAQTAAAFGSATSVILASGETGRTADALAASFLAGVRTAPVVLTPQAGLSASTRSALTTLRANGATSVTVVGGTAAVSDAVLTEVRALGFTVDRLAGNDRYGTAAAVVAAGESPTASNVGIVASGTSTADALAVGPLAYKGNHPLFLVTAGGIPASTLSAMQAAGVTSVYIVGGTTVVGPEVASQLASAGITVVDRLAGVDRSATSRAIADALIANFGFSTNTFNLASGANEGVDALSGAAVSGRENRVLLLTNTATNAGSADDFATARANTLNAAGRIFGGTAVVAQEVETAVENAGGAATANQTFAVTPAGEETLSLVVDDEPNVASDDRTYTVATPAAGQTHRIVLVPAASVTVGANGAVTFEDDDDNGLADFGDVAARITSVNSIALTTPSATATAVPVAGTITFTIDGNGVESVRPVVFFDADDDGLDLDANNAPVAAEPFGVGGVTTFTNPAAASQTLTATAVQSVNKGANQFDASDEVFTYDTNDTFRISGIPVTFDQFEAALSSGDEISATYTTNAALSSSFNLVDANPTNPESAPTATAGTGANSNDVTVTATVAGNADEVQIQRATVSAAAAVGTFTTVATEPATDDDADTEGVQVVYVDNDVPAGTYQYRYVVVNDGDVSEPSPATATVTTTAPGPDVTGPTAVTTTRTTDAGFAGVMDAGDVFFIRASEALAPPAAGSTIRVQDADGTVADLVCGTNVTCAVNASAIPATPTTDPNAGAAAGTVLTVTLTAAPAVVSAGDTAGVQYDATIINTAGINDVAGNRLQLDDADDDLTIGAATTTTTTTP